MVTTVNLRHVTSTYMITFENRDVARLLIDNRGLRELVGFAAETTGAAQVQICIINGAIMMTFNCGGEDIAELIKSRVEGAIEEFVWRDSGA